MRDMIDTDKICFLIIKARELEAKVAPVIPDPGENPSDEGVEEISGDYEDDATHQELADFLAGLNDQEKALVQALFWIGQGEYVPSDWESAMQDSRDSLDEQTVRRLMMEPMLADHLENWLSEFELSCEDVAAEHL